MKWKYLDGMDFIILAISDSFTYQFCLAIFSLLENSKWFDWMFIDYFASLVFGAADVIAVTAAAAAAVDDVVLTTSVSPFMQLFNRMPCQ